MTRAEETHALAILDYEYWLNNQGTSDSSSPCVFQYADRKGDR